MAPRLVALLPQAQIKTESGLIEQSQGFHVVFLPFADDMRNLDKVMVREEGDEWPKGKFLYYLWCFVLVNTVSKYQIQSLQFSLEQFLHFPLNFFS